MSVTTLHRPGHREALHELQAAFDRGDVITIFGRCTVTYEGRAASDLGPGDRLVILKPDGTALVHTAEQRTPVNWQPPGCEHRASVREGRLRIRSVRSNPDERLDVRFERVHQLSALPMSGAADLALRGSEEDLRQRILREPALLDPGFEPLATERETAAGAVDVFGRDDEDRPVVVELKRRRVGPSAAGQLKRYVDAVERETGDGCEVRGILVAPSVTDRTADLLDAEGLEFVALGPGTESSTSAGPEASAASEASEAAARPEAPKASQESREPGEQSEPGSGEADPDPDANEPNEQDSRGDDGDRAGDDREGESEEGDEQPPTPEERT